MTNEEIKSLIHYSILVHSLDEEIEEARINLYISKYPFYSWTHGFLWNGERRFTLFEAIIILLTKNTKASQKRIAFCKDRITSLTKMRDEYELLCWEKID